MNLDKLNKFLSYILVSVLTAVITVIVILGKGIEVDTAQTKLDTLEQLILDCFIGETDQTAIEDAAANAMIGALGDRWSHYIPADQYAQYKEQMKNAYVGIGITISVRKDGTGLDIKEVTAGGSAEEAGLQAGDIIVAVNKERIKDYELSAVRDLIRGEADTQVDITVLRDKQELTVSVTRKQIKTPVAVGRLLDGKIGLVRIVNFNDNCADEAKQAIEELLNQGAEKMIFDVRYNPGGYAKELVKILDYLLPEGPLFRTEDYTGKEKTEYSDEEYLDVPMAVLVNGDSYSAAEFFAAALSEYDAAVVVGEQTSGKGYYQNTYELPDGSAVGLSIGKYYTPHGVSLADKGITPNVVVPVKQEIASAIYAGTLEPDQDPQIQAAIKALQEN